MVNTSVVGAERGEDGVWAVSCKQGAQRDLARWQGDGRSRNGELLAAADEAADRGSAQDVVVKGRVVVNAAGLFGDVVESFRQASRTGQASAGRALPFEVKPRKGQCLVIKPTARSPPPPEHVLEQIATQVGLRAR